MTELALGLLIGAVVGGGGGTEVGHDRGWAAEGFAGAAGLGLALCCYATSVAPAARRSPPRAAWRRNWSPSSRTPAPCCRCWSGPVFGAVAVVPALEAFTWQTALYAVLSLTVSRMVPMAPVLTGAGLGRPALLCVGRFGPRGLTSVVFGLLALEQLDEPAVQPAVTVIAFTVLLSVLAHGHWADPLAKPHGPRPAAPSGKAAAASAGPAEVPERRLIRRTPAVGRFKE
ncbi:hypothetical protein [Kitasatospora sp. NPDC091207]|uniref:hypothetical protein n=1 Tax=Kitasatospora sp. NPDC091207 TaxID=3364083 RepID=UPI00382100DA